MWGQIEWLEVLAVARKAEPEEVDRDSVIAANCQSGDIGGGVAFNAAGESAVAPCFMAPTIAGVLSIARAFHEGRFAERSASQPSTEG